MKECLLGAIALVVLGSTADAADLAAHYTKAAPTLVPSWTGFYLNGGGGYGLWAADDHATISGAPTGFSGRTGSRGYFGTIGGGYDYQFASSWVAGIFADAQFGDLKGTINAPNFIGLSGQTKNNTNWAVGGRLGYLITPKVLSYVNAGYSNGHFRSAALADGNGGPTLLSIDVLFLLDVTGSMGDEIDQLKATIGDVADQLRGLAQHPDIRFGMTLFRDEGDAFVTSTFDLTGDIAAFQAALDEVHAGGGGDTPEAVDEAFAAALDEPSWRDPASTAQFVFLIGDAAPQVQRAVQQPYPVSIKAAQARGITVHAVAASSTDDGAEHAFRAIAQATGGRFVFLAYGAGGAALGEHTDIASTDYEELSLDALVVRLVAESLAALTGGAVVPPPTVAPTTIEQPDGQSQTTG